MHLTPESAECVLTIAYKRDGIYWYNVESNKTRDTIIQKH